MDAAPSRPDPAGAPTGPLARLDRWHAALLRLVGPNGRPVRKALLLAPALVPLAVPFALLSAALGAPAGPEPEPLTAGRMFAIVAAAPVLETWFVIGLYCVATAPDRLAWGEVGHGGAARLLGALFTGAAMAALHTPYSPGRLAYLGVFFAAQALQYEAWRREYRFWSAYGAVALTHCVNNSIAAGLLLLLRPLE